MQVVYLTGERIYLRAPVEEDAEHAVAWFDSPFPINGSRAKTFFEEQPSFWWDADAFQLIMARTENDQLVGGVSLESSDWRTGSIRFHMAPALDDADALRSEALRLVIPWLSEEHEFMVARVHLAADESATIAAAEELGMQPSVRLREWFARGGTRVDAIVYEALNPRWEVRDA